MKIRIHNILTCEDELLDLGVDLWDREQELDMPYWYWVDGEYCCKKGKIVAIRNRVKRLERLNDGYWQDQHDCQNDEF